MSKLVVVESFDYLDVHAPRRRVARIISWASKIAAPLLLVIIVLKFEWKCRGINWNVITNPFHSHVLGLP